MSTKNPTPPTDPDDQPGEPPIEREIVVEPGEPITIDVPEGTRQVTINVDPTLMGAGGGYSSPPENSFQSCSRSCGSVGLGCAGVLFVFWILGMLFAR